MKPTEPTPRPLKYSMCVSGAHAGPTVHDSALLAEALGKSIAEAGQIITTGATIGLPYYAAYGAKKAGGTSIGFSPASNLREHLRKYRLPRDCYDFIIFTGMHYVGRDQYMIQSSDVIITVGGSFGSLHEFTSALVGGKPCGILTGSGGTADIIPELMRLLKPPDGDLVIYDDNPERLVKRCIALLDEKYQDIHDQLLNHDEHWFLHANPPPHRAG